MKDRDFDSSAPVEAETATVEAWATLRGDVDPPRVVGAPVAFSQHKAWRFLAAKALRGWAKHQVVSGADYDAAVKAATDDLQVK
jgi:hypothetical protein